MRGIWTYFLGLLTGLGVVALLMAIDYLTYDPELARKLHEQDAQLVDAIAIAGQLGRLDFISTILALIGILLVFAALPVYRLILVRCQDIIRKNWKELEEKVAQDVEEVAISRLEAKLPDMHEDYMKMIQAMDQNSDDLADDIGEAQDDE